MTPKEAVTFARDHGVRMVDLKFMDFPGLWQHFSIPISAFDGELVQRTTGILVKREGLSEPEAFGRIQKFILERRRPMVEIAEAILLSEEMAGRKRR